MSLPKPGYAQIATSTYTEQYKAIKAPSAVAKLGPDLFGDNVNLYNGGLQFVQTDVSLKGNNSLPVAVGRKLDAGRQLFDDRGFGRWTLDIPRMHGVFAMGTTSSPQGWNSKDGENNRCYNFGAPPEARGLSGYSGWSAEEFWQGNHMYVPSAGDQRMLLRDPGYTLTPSAMVVDGVPVSSFPIVTSAKWSIGCLPKLANLPASEGQGFLAVSPDGTKYKFDWMVKREANGLTKKDISSASNPTSQPKSSDAAETEVSAYSQDKAESEDPPSTTATETQRLPRVEVWILPTKVIDRFGNWVSYTYDPNKHENLIRIDSSDERHLTLTYEIVNGVTSNRIKTVSDGVRTWTYSYRGVVKTLDRVTLPDASFWDFSEADELMVEIGFQSEPVNCSDHKVPFMTTRIGSMVHPSGARGTFTLTPVEHGRSNVQEWCIDKNPWIPIFYWTNTLTRKSISGPGLKTADWTYSFGAPNGSYLTCAGVCLKTETVEVTDPDGDITRYTFGNQYGVDEGKLQRTETGWNGSSALRTTDVTYAAASPANPYPAQAGTSDFAMGDDGTDQRFYPEDSRVTTQQGVTFSSRVNAFDKLARPVKVTQSSTLGYSKMTVTDYADQISDYRSLLDIWVLGLVTKTAERDPSEPASWSVVNQVNTFYPNGNLYTTESMGVKKTYVFNTNGTLKSIDDGKAQLTNFGNWRAGLPQLITYPDLTTEKATVTEQGFITSTTDAAGQVYTYQPDPMLRVATIQPPLVASVGAHPIQVAFTQVNATEKNIAAGHWRQDVSTGNARTRTYLDAMWRPLVTETWDEANPAETRRVVSRNFDIDGKEVFASYPGRNFDEYAKGVTTQFDALGRPTLVTANSEIGDLLTTYDYLDGFKKSVKNPRGFTTVTSYQAFSEPSEDAIAEVAMSRNIKVTIARHPWGATKSITRADATNSVTRRYVYDPVTRQLCKTIEPETKATVQKYDTAGNVAWRAAGLPLLSENTCDNASVLATQKTVFAYDKLNRLLTTTYGDASPAVARTYTPDGLPLTVNSGGANWTYDYNERRLLKTETLAYGSGSYKFTRDYDAYGSPTQLTYPDNSAVTYKPNALGEPSEVGAYASLIKYYPSGAIQSFTYGNGIKHTLEQNMRGLPRRSTDLNVLDDVYSYDQNANVGTITDSKESITSRTMYYDELDRLTRVSAPALWGNVAYDYDANDNLTLTNMTGGGAIARLMSHKHEDGTNRLTSITGTSGFASGAIIYDAQGNVKTRGSQSFVFDMANRIKEVTGKATYLYDGHGRRMSSVGTDGVNRVQVYAQDGQLLFTKPTNGGGTKYIYLKKHQIAEVAP